MSIATEELQEISDCLTEAEYYGLTDKVIWSALNAMKENPELTIEEAITIGLNEWVK